MQTILYFHYYACIWGNTNYKIRLLNEFNWMRPMKWIFVLLSFNNSQVAQTFGLPVGPKGPCIDEQPQNKIEKLLASISKRCTFAFVLQLVKVRIWPSYRTHFWHEGLDTKCSQNTKFNMLCYRSRTPNTHKYWYFAWRMTSFNQKLVKDLNYAHCLLPCRVSLPLPCKGHKVIFLHSVTAHKHTNAYYDDNMRSNEENRFSHAACRLLSVD